MGALGTLIPLVVLSGFIGAVAWIGYQMYIYTNDLADRGKKHLEKKNIVYTKDGMKVNVKNMSDEEINDKAQRGMVNTWNNASFPGYKSKVWNSEATPNFQRTPSGNIATTTGSSRPTSSRTSSQK